MSFPKSLPNEVLNNILEDNKEIIMNFNRKIEKKIK